MENKKLYGITGLFDSPDAIIHAAEKVSDAGYNQYDINTPYPMHGMSKAMKLKASPLGYFALALGLTGTALALSFMYWVNNFDYPLVIGGKPMFPFPAFVPIMFEVTVLLASVGTVLTMLLLFFRLPNNAHPLQDTDYMKAVSVDKFGVVIEAKDKKFDAAAVRSMFAELGATDINEVYFDDAYVKNDYKIYTPKFIMFLLTTGVVVSAIAYYTLNIALYQTPFNWMMNQDKGKVQSASVMFADGKAMRNPVEGTVADGYLPYAFKDKPEEAMSALSNPLLPTKETLALGKQRFLTYCSPCHGNYAQADSRLNGQFPLPPSLHTDKVRNWPDGRIYHIITEGQNLMPSYASQILRNDRWAIVLYVRALQRALNAKEEDLK